VPHVLFPETATCLLYVLSYVNQEVLAGPYHVNHIIQYVSLGPFLAHLLQLPAHRLKNTVTTPLCSWHGGGLHVGLVCYLPHVWERISTKSPFLILFASLVGTGRRASPRRIMNKDAGTLL